MITRAQAEALLTLAESLEACERLNIGVVPSFDGSQNLQFLDSSAPFARVSALHGKKVRNAVSELVPKTSIEEHSYTVGPKGVTNKTRIVKPK